MVIDPYVIKTIYLIGYGNHRLAGCAGDSLEIRCFLAPVQIGRVVHVLYRIAKPCNTGISEASFSVIKDLK